MDLRESIEDVVTRVFVTVHRGVLRASGGRLGSRLAGMPVVVLTTTGRRTGRARSIPVSGVEHEGRMLLVASGHRDFDRHPAWYLNLRDQPRVTAAVGGRHPRPMTARTLNGTEKEAVWPVIVARWKGYAAYQQRTSRDIPVVELQPAGDDT